MTTWWWKGHSRTQSFTEVVPPWALCVVWCTWQAPAGWVQPPGCFRYPHRRDGAGIMEDMLTTDYDGCGRCLVGSAD